MATDSGHHQGQAAGTALAEQDVPNGRLVEFEAFIDAQLHKTRSHVRSVDIAANVMILAAGTLGFLLVAAAFDHWIVAGGLGIWGRSLFLAIYLAAAAAFLIVPHAAARDLQHQSALRGAHHRAQPAVAQEHGGELPVLCADRGGLSPVMYEAVEEQAAANLATARVDAAVDRSNLIKIGYLLLGVVLLCAIYAVLSPKDLFQTVGRIVAPWADIGAPTSTTITEIEPGDAQAFRGQQVTLRARIQDLPDDGKAIAYYSTADGQVVDRAIEMSLGEDGYKYACRLPAGEATLQQDVRYRIEAGDAISRDFHVEVVAAPTIFVRTVEYKYPEYTGLLAQRVERQGDIKAIEGTEITLDALANGEIQSAHVDFDCDGTLDQRMTVDGELAKATFRLALGDDRKTSKYESYQLLFKNPQGQQNPQPVRHQIEVTRDIPPEIDFLAPTKDEIDLPANGSLDWEIVANDPDFALRTVKLSAMKGKQPLFDKLVLDAAHRGQFVAKYRFEPAKLELKPGDVVEYSALAEDNKDPNPNRVETPKHWIRIVSPDDRRQNQDRVAQNDPSDDPRGQPGDRGAGAGDEHPRDGQPSDDNGAESPDGGPPNPTQDSERGENRQQQRNDDEQERGDGDNASGQPGEGQKGAGPQAEGQPNEGQQGDREQNEGQPDAGEQAEGQQGQGEQGEGKQGEGKQGKGADSGDRGAAGQQGQSAERGVASDGSNDGDAIEQILKHRQQQQPEQDQAAGQRPQDDRGGDQRANDKQSGDGQADRSAREQDAPRQGEQPGRQQQEGDQRQDVGGQPNAGEQQGGNQRQAADRKVPEQNAGQQDRGAQQKQDDPQDRGARDNAPTTCPTARMANRTSKGPAKTTPRNGAPASAAQRAQPPGTQPDSKQAHR